MNRLDFGEKDRDKTRIELFFAYCCRDLRIMGNALYKTQLCQNMMKNEYCPKGDDCIFAHSFEEQRSSGSFTPAFGVVQVFHLAFTWTFLESERI